MKERPIKLFLNDILNSAKKILVFTENMSYEEFIKDEKTIDAVIRNLEIMGEASKYIPESIREKYKDIPFKQIAGMRNILIHNYLGVSLKSVWKVVIEILPELNPKLEILINNDFPF